MGNSETVLMERVGAVMRLTLNRPAFANTINTELAHALMESAISCDEDDAVRCVLLTGSGKLFCGGGDVGEFMQAGERVGALLKTLTTHLHTAISRLARMNKPLVTAIQGPAAGAGLSLALLGDVALAARGAHFTAAYTAIGLSPDGGCTWLLPRLIGLRRAQELVLLNRRLNADEAASLGLITRAVDDAVLATEAMTVAEQFAGAATRALGRARQLLGTSFGAEREAHMEAEARAIAESAATADAREGISAFAARRKPRFAGR
jgi:2-(1,2-epoxy-1,2-dihydrophenyl)acetyl-CoA isomerase